MSRDIRFFFRRGCAPFPYFELLPELRSLVRGWLRLRHRSALARTCRQALVEQLADDPLAFDFPKTWYRTIQQLRGSAAGPYLGRLMESIHGLAWHRRPGVVAVTMPWAGKRRSLRGTWRIVFELHWLETDGHIFALGLAMPLMRCSTLYITAMRNWKPFGVSAARLLLWTRARDFGRDIH